MQNQQNPIDFVDPSGEKLLVVSIGHHTRLGDALEYALAGTAFESIDSDAFLRGNWQKRKLLFTISTEETGENASLRSLKTALRSKSGFLDDCVCAAIVDGALGGLAHLYTLTLLLAANQSGALVISRPLIEGDRELRYFSGGKESPFERYREQARLLIGRLIAEEAGAPVRSNLRLLTTLDSGVTHDWRALLSRMAAQRGGELTEFDEPYDTVLLCENRNGLPDEETLSLLNASGRLRIFLTSPATGSELYVACLVERACLQGGYALMPRALLVFEGLSAVEVLSIKRETERVQALLAQ